MNENFIPKINCRFKIRQETDNFIGFFQGKGILTFNEVGAFIVNQMKGKKSLKKIGQLVKDTFPKIKNPSKEVISIALILNDSNFF